MSNLARRTAEGKTSSWDGKLVGEEFRFTWDVHGYKLEELPAKGKKKLRVTELSRPLSGMQNRAADVFITENLLRRANISKNDSYDSVKKKFQGALDDACAEFHIQNPDTKHNYDWIDKTTQLDAYEKTVHFLQVIPEGLEPIKAEGKDFTLSSTWTEFSVASPDSDFQQADPHYTKYESKSAAPARKLYQILRADPNALKSVSWSGLPAWFQKNKVSYETNFSSW